MPPGFLSHSSPVLRDCLHLTIGHSSLNTYSRLPGLQLGLGTLISGQTADLLAPISTRTMLCNAVPMLKRKAQR
jgi:hypothetical protein